MKPSGDASKRRTAAGFFRPPTSPDFHPTEHAFAQLEAFRRKAEACTQEALEAAIAADLATLPAKDARAWFKHCQFPLAFHAS